MLRLTSRRRAGAVPTAAAEIHQAPFRVTAIDARFAGSWIVLRSCSTAATGAIADSRWRWTRSGDARDMTLADLAARARSKAVVGAPGSTSPTIRATHQLRRPLLTCGGEA